MLELNVSVRRGDFVLAADIALAENGTGLLGPAGAGKSTVLGLLAGTLQPLRGLIALDGQIWFDSRKSLVVPPEQRPIAAVLQNSRLPPGEKVKVSLAAAYERTPRQRRRLDPRVVIERLDLGTLLDRQTHELSAGETRQVALARALLKSPRLLLLDEPFAPLAPHLRTPLRSLLGRIQSELTIATVYASQSPADLLGLAERLIVLSGGRVHSDGTLVELARNPRAMQSLGLHPVNNFLAATVIRHELEEGYTLASTFGIDLLLPLRTDLAAGSRLTVVLPSSDIALSRRYLTDISIQNQIKGRICALIPTGNSVLVQVDCGTTLLAGITPRAVRDMGLTEGDEIYCLAKTQSFIFLNGGHASHLTQERPPLPFQPVADTLTHESSQ